MAKCKNCPATVKKGFFSQSRSLLQGSTEHFFCNPLCREVYKQANGIQVYDRRP